MQARAGVADDLGEPPLDRHVHVLVVRLDLEAVLVDLRPDCAEAALDRREVVVADDLAVARASARGRATARGRTAPAGSRTRSTSSAPGTAGPVARRSATCAASHTSGARVGWRSVPQDEGLRVRRFRPDDAAAADRSALRELGRDVRPLRRQPQARGARASLARSRREGNTASADVVWVAELDGAGRGRDGGDALRRVDAARAAVPARDAAKHPALALAGRAVALPGERPDRARAAAAPASTSIRWPPTPLRRRGVARALLEEAERQALAARAWARWRSTPGSTTARPARST